MTDLTSLIRMTDLGGLNTMSELSSKIPITDLTSLIRLTDLCGLTTMTDLASKIPITDQAGLIRITVGSIWSMIDLY